MDPAGEQGRRDRPEHQGGDEVRVAGHLEEDQDRHQGRVRRRGEPFSFDAQRDRSHAGHRRHGLDKGSLRGLPITIPSEKRGREINVSDASGELERANLHTGRNGTGQAASSVGAGQEGLNDAIIIFAVTSIINMTAGQVIAAGRGNWGRALRSPIIPAVALGVICAYFGVTLPLFSYGGSSLLTVMIGMGLLMNVSIRRYSY